MYRLLSRLSFPRKTSFINSSKQSLRNLSLFVIPAAILLSIMLGAFALPVLGNNPNPSNWMILLSGSEPQGETVIQDVDPEVWDFLPINTSEIKQVEVLRGPASAMWGANAAAGVVNIITKTPRESEG